MGQFIQNLPDHDTRAFERGFAVADFGVGHDIFAQFNAPMFSVFHCHYYSRAMLNNKPGNFCFNFSR
jgi:hypothetical protein